MGFVIFMLIMVLLIPLTMLFFGWLLFRKTEVRQCKIEKGRANLLRR